jgi:hypothetical protein
MDTKIKEKANGLAQSISRLASLRRRLHSALLSGGPTINALTVTTTTKNPPNKRTQMNNPLNEVKRRIEAILTGNSFLNKFGASVGAVALTAALPVAAASPTSLASSMTDPAGDAVFPYDLYGAPVPACLDVTKASVTLTHGVFQFEIQVACDIPANADPGFTPAVNHLGNTFGILTDRKTAGTPFKFFGQTDTYHFNYLVGALYSVADSGIGLDLGWQGFLIDGSTFTAVEVPLRIHGNTFTIEVSADALGNPASFEWAVGSECDPVSIPDEKTKSVLLVDYTPDHGTATWPARNP